MTPRRKALITAAVVTADLIVGILMAGDTSQEQRDRVHTANVEYFNTHCFNPAGDRVC